MTYADLFGGGIALYGDMGALYGSTFTARDLVFQAGPPRARWTAGQVSGVWSASEPAGRWASRPAAARWKAGTIE